MEMTKLTDAEIKELARKTKNRYQREWHRKHKENGIDKRKKYAKRYWRKKALEELKTS